MTKEEWLAVRKQLPDGPQGYWTVGLWLLDMSILGGAWLLWTRGSLLARVCAVVLAELSVIQIYLILHEAIHRSVCRNRFINEAVGHASGWLIALPFLPRRRNHLGHHAWTAHPKRDPENKGMIEKFSVMTEQQARTLEFLWRHWIPIIAINHFVNHWLCVLRPPAGDAARKTSKQEARFAVLYLAGYGLLAYCAAHAGVFAEFAAFVAILLVLLWLAVELLNLPHHAEIPLLANDAQRPPLWEQDIVSHSCRSVPIWSKYIILSFNLHIAHHAFPWIAWYQLPRTQRILDAKNLDPAAKQMDEWEFSLTNRRRPLLQLMGHFFDKRAPSRPQV
ncbi:fatty acid desaturase [Burkholderia sp. FERM BP-3421]|uniref:fatty acid desaturase family protein n=1 Tax=Burkholderia sp. FERM BP-3421 TaxID=1494466 RepID=UPI0023609CC3|nr:fatty acid desaturase [Burkholderia sp. FERM BP-3421]WDD91344.1 fatty acid desaturase [Burkholderia sp. FERM BP-3421]